MSEAPAALVSVPCPDCARRASADCPRCSGHGIVMLRLRPQEAALPREELARRLHDAR